MSLRLALVSDIHGNVAALEAALAEIEQAAPDHILILGDLVQNGPRPAEVIDAVQALEAGGAYVIAGNTDIAVADGDYAAAFPWLDEVSAAHRAVAEWTREQLSDEQLEYLRRLPAERRVAFGDELVLGTHGSPGSQTLGLPADLDPAITVQRVTRSDARVIACGHTHVAEVREFGRKLIVNPGSCGYAFDGTPDACWGLITLEQDADPTAALFRASYDPNPTAELVADRGLAGDVYGAATIRTGRFVR